MIAGPTVYSPTRVYCTSILEFAVQHAAAWRLGIGAVYEVEPLGEIERDPDDPTGCAVMCERARVLRRVELDQRLMRYARATARRGIAA